MGRLSAEIRDSSTEEQPDQDKYQQTLQKGLLIALNLPGIYGIPVKTEYSIHTHHGKTDIGELSPAVKQLVYAIGKYAEAIDQRMKAIRETKNPPI